MTMRYKDVLLATRSDLRDALIAGDTDKAERIYQECEAECAPRVDCQFKSCAAPFVCNRSGKCQMDTMNHQNDQDRAILAANKEPQ